MARPKIDPNDYQGRLNAMMSKYQRALARIAELEAQQGAPGAPEGSQTPSAPGNGPSAPDASKPGQVPLADAMAQRARQVAEDRAAALDAEDRALAERVAQVRTEKARAAALAKFPGIEPLADMLTYDGDDEAFLKAAEELNAALGGETASEPAPPPAPPVLASNAPMVAPSADERLDDIKARARAGDQAAWSEYFALKQEQALRAAGHIQ